MLVLRLAAPLVLAALADASTWIVDAAGGPGSNFTDLPPAIAAALPGDVLIVRAGSYSAVTGLDKALTIVGQGVVTLASSLTYDFQVQNLPAGPPLSITNIRTHGILVDHAAASVLFQRVHATAGAQVSNASDVRLDQMDGTLGAVSVLNARVEIASTTIVGANGSDGQSGNPWFPAQGGANGLVLSGTSRVQLARSSVRGGDGGNNSQAGNGGHGILVLGGELFLDGAGLAVVRGGDGGIGDDCALDGDGGDGLRIAGGSVTRSGASFVAGVQGSCGSAGIAVHLLAGSDLLQTPDAPTLQLSGAPTPGSSVTWTVFAEPGASVRLQLGRTPHVLPLPGILIEELLVPLRVYDLGVVPAAGSVTKSLTLPAAWPLGTRLIAQASVDLASVSETRRTSSSVLIAR